jgi:hypothetical protein
MTAPARITQDDMARATRAVAAAGFDRARIIMDLRAQTIEIILGHGAPETESVRAAGEWTDDDT